jgi:predicted nucleic acid-binding Zn finger protein
MLIKSKWGNKKTIYAGQTFHSKKESEYARDLDILVSGKFITSYESQVPFNMVVNGVKICKYVLDFKIVYPDGRIEYVDIKPFDKKKQKFICTDVFKLKMKLMKACHGIDIILR